MNARYANTEKTEHDVVAMINESDISADSLLVFVSSAGMIKERLRRVAFYQERRNHIKTGPRVAGKCLCPE